MAMGIRPHSQFDRPTVPVTGIRVRVIVNTNLHII